MNITRKTFQYGQHTITLETGRIAKQATASVWVTMGETIVSVSMVAKKDVAVGQDFFPLTVNYLERTYAAGQIPGGHFKREGRPSENETLTSRLIDRALRPLFPEGFFNEIQITATLVSLDPNVPGDIPAMIGSAAALSISGLPFGGPIAAARVGRIDNAWVLNPSFKDIQRSDLDLVIAGTKNAVLMVESEAKQLSEQQMLEALRFGHDHLQTVNHAIDDFSRDVAAAPWNWSPAPKNHALIQEVSDLVRTELESAYQIQEKLERYARIASAKAKAVNTFATGADTAPSAKAIEDIIFSMESDIVRGRILANKPRIDGRDHLTVRPITIELGLLPRAHGSVLFTRGETQALVVVTLGTDKDGQLVDALDGEYRETFMLHYNFPPYCVGETGPSNAPKRREIGHGRLARRGVQAVVPENLDAFPYVIRAVSEITESNGSSSMASVCGTSLALMDAGVPTKAHVAGIAMGLIKEGDQYAVITDILGDEDHLGDMDFKVAGTREGITALQMDIKIDGITFDIMEKALSQAQQGRLHILGLMESAITGPRQALSKHAPMIMTVQIKPEQIKDVIGKGGETIKSITESTHTTIDISETGLVKIAAQNQEDGEAACERVRQITMEIEEGSQYQGKVVRIVEFGAFVNLKPGKDGLVHISQISEERVNNVADYLQEGQIVTVRVLEVDRQGKIKLTMKGM
ncbi:MAG: polyribonucleotide nucleotidyltransferase [Gammaproteobacteria bacterium]|nr:polyribonucleotide nucleotidyltransferase [Gammaproteobacteria bacterium]MCD8543177.1 polyribonucleotide nucleotidyltransferase [Gammaproteobacteria bacterium]